MAGLNGGCFSKTQVHEAVCTAVIDSGTWATAVHAEPHQTAGSGATIGVNVEALKEGSASGRVIGVHVQSNTSNCDQAINIQNSWATGIHFETTSSGTRGIWMRGSFTVGLDMGDNHIRLKANKHIALDETEAVFIKYNSTSNRIELWRSGTCVGSF